MTLQARMSQGDSRLYSPDRDVAHNFDHLIMEVANRCELHTWPALHEVGAKFAVHDEVLGQVCQALCRFIVIQADNKKEGMGECLARSGFFDLPEVARMLVMAYLGTVTLGVHWHGVREATLGGQGPTAGYRKLRWYGMRCAKLMTMPLWRRRLYLLKLSLRRAWRAFWGSYNYED